MGRRAAPSQQGRAGQAGGVFSVQICSGSWAGAAGGCPAAGRLCALPCVGVCITGPARCASFACCACWGAGMCAACPREHGHAAHRCERGARLSVRARETCIQDLGQPGSAQGRWQPTGGASIARQARRVARPSLQRPSGRQRKRQTPSCLSVLLGGTMPEGSGACAARDERDSTHSVDPPFAGLWCFFCSGWRPMACSTDLVDAQQASLGTAPAAGSVQLFAAEWSHAQVRR